MRDELLDRNTNKLKNEKEKCPRQRLSVGPLGITPAGVDETAKRERDKCDYEAPETRVVR